MKKTQAQKDAEIDAASRALTLANLAPASKRAEWMKRFPVGMIVDRKDKFAKGVTLMGLVVDADHHANRVRIVWDPNHTTSRGQWHPITQIQALTRPRKKR